MVPKAMDTLEVFAHQIIGKSGRRSWLSPLREDKRPQKVLVVVSGNRGS